MKITRYELRYKLTKPFKNFDVEKCKVDVSRISLSILSTFDNPDEELCAFRKIFFSMIDENVFLKRVKMRGPRAPWMKDLQINELPIAI